MKAHCLIFVGSTVLVTKVSWRYFTPISKGL